MAADSKDSNEEHDQVSWLRHAPSKAIDMCRSLSFEGVMQWERVLRLVAVELPKLVFYYIPGAHQVISFFFIYVMLQALAILWGFLTNISAIFGGNVSTLVTMPLTQAACVLFTYVSVIGIVLSFGRAMWIVTWQSVHNFPLIRRTIAVENRPQVVILTVALPCFLLVPSLIAVPLICDGNGPSRDTWTQVLCHESYMKFLSNNHPMFQRSLRLSTVIATFQFLQLCLEILPNWRRALRSMSTLSTLALGGYLFLLSSAGVLWFVEWLVRHFRYQLTFLSSLPSNEWEIYGQSLLLAWVVYFVIVTCFTYDTVAKCEPSQQQLSGFFERLKLSFAVGQLIIFTRACILPSMGFVHAQLELTIINLLLPSIYVISLIGLRMISLVSKKSLLISFPLALFGAASIFTGSKMTDRPHPFAVVFVFLFDRALRWTGSTKSRHSRVNKLPSSLQEMLRRTKIQASDSLPGHRAAKIFVIVAVCIVCIHVAMLSGFSILSVLQRSAKWYPDATSVSYKDNSIDIQHTAVVKLKLGLANETHPPMYREEPLYMSCENRWHGLNIVDLALLSEAAYFDPLSDDIKDFVRSLAGGHLGHIDVHLPPTNTKTGSKLDFFEMHIPALNTSVISVRGTDIWRPTDFIEDVKMFFEPVIFAMISAVFPTVRIWPDTTFATLIELYSELVSLFGLRHDFWYYSELLEYVESIKDRHVILTGHSMGGGIARLVASIVGKISVTFSPPGHVQSYGKQVHDIGGESIAVNRAKLHHRSVAVIPEYDPVTMIDVQSGMMQKISCDTPNLSMQLSCHMLEGTLCNLLENCGDPRKRIASCHFSHDIKSATDDVLPKLLVLLSPKILAPIVTVFTIILSVLFRWRSSRPKSRAGDRSSSSSESENASDKN